MFSSVILDKKSGLYGKIPIMVKLSENVLHIPNAGHIRKIDNYITN